MSAVSLSQQAQHADRVVVVKSQHTMTLYSHGTAIKTYRVALGRGGLGPKQRSGDNLTPEGTYFLDAKKTNSRFHLAFHVSYPNAEDRVRAKKLGVDPGGDVEVHGLENGLGFLGGIQHDFDWTEGCIALSNSEI
jgi:murein L,D-transpeptidase YafK